MADPALMVSMQDVQKWFGDLHVLQDINLAIKPGEVVVVIGPSGSGKSTLCRAINRLETINEGTIEIDGKKLPEEGKALAELRADVGMVFQSFNLFAHKTVLENVTLGPIKVRGHKQGRREEARHGAVRTRGQSRPRPASCPRSSPAVSSSASRSRVRWRWIRRSCSSTSRRQPLTRR